ncbi:MAG TPA: hypothetical protein DCX14_12930 [Flavobacteriales bacterium]|jgi:hypothetical protein|nr:T9SS type A sorting domain-containing protein [Flavobacteriales bacterium]MDB9701548.1 T9SS type A sorting domain-containing protein [Salibacteraceae bacterium]HAW21078.1 hypothetical protein [Flavobacteriales bacterium]
MKLSLLLAFLFLTCSLNAQINETYFTGFDTPAQRAHWQEFKLGDTINQIYEWEISNFVFHSDSSALVHYYPVGGTEVTNDWYVSPGFDCTHGGRVDSIWVNYAGFGVPMAGDTVALYMLEGSPNPELASQITLIHSFGDTAYHNDNVWRKLDTMTIPAAQDSVYFGFRYNTIINWLDVRFDDMGITLFRPAPPTGIAESSAITLKIYPNPSNGFIQIQTSEIDPIEIQISDLTGRVIRIEQIQSSAQFQLDRGMYLVSSALSSDKRSTQIVVVQ